MRIETSRMYLVPATPESLRAELDGLPLAGVLNVRVPRGWPPELYEPAVARYTLERLVEDAGAAAWWMWYFIRRGDGAEQDTLVGIGGYKGQPGADGTVEIGYSIVAQFQRQGYASEAATGLVRYAFGDARVRRVIAETLPDGLASMAVLRRCGFEPVSDGADPGVRRFELRRECWRG